ncbi:hypothetical protein JYB87_12960 [Shewanella avicenniae]|uniref:Beta-galactosidase n=1 Tax=Shewanella avicenniae TaxID=2814294 RepID=A0ABX7QMJ3_9GAMM|nr:sugar-binding domain-containing protein [Shewanella avicenniae]QSX32656.1 hypothetical protein JYB87_12960 [Shewanella avicenniae]
MKLLTAAILLVLGTFGVCADTLSLNGNWKFRIDKENIGEDSGWFKEDVATSQWVGVSVPHTWNVDTGSETYKGTAWYARTVQGPLVSNDKHISLEFDGVYRDSKVWVNGHLVSQHNDSGYTQFSVPVEHVWRRDSTNTIVVEVNNDFSPRALPIDESFDWANDGGITRDVRLVTKPENYIGKVLVDSKLTDDLSSATVTVDAYVSPDELSGKTLTFTFLDPNDNVVSYVKQVIGDDILSYDSPLRHDAQHVSKFPVVRIEAKVDNPVLWHFDHPKQYRVIASVSDGGELTDQYEMQFGIRSLRLRDGFYFLNNEPMRLMGIEWMPGSHPLYGMASSKPFVQQILRDLKALNVIITRFHWQQSDDVFDFMDDEGMLVQEEIPAWQRLPSDDNVALTQKNQFKSMIFSHFNHPSIYAWGIGNEMSESPQAAQFVKAGADIIADLDSSRLSVYASNKLQLILSEQQARASASDIPDFIEYNEYYGTWHEGSTANILPTLNLLSEVYPHKSVVISEFGLCECDPKFEKGDQFRIEALSSHTSEYKKAENVAGAIFFSYNDYRTHMGDVGENSFQSRVHGIVDIYGNKKPSWQAFRETASPLSHFSVVRSKDNHFAVAIQSRSLKDIPAYTLNEYTLIWTAYDDAGLPVQSGKRLLPKLAPGDSYKEVLPSLTETAARIRAEIFRPTGYSVQEATLAL